MRKICNVCKAERESSLVHEMPCLEPGCSGSLIEVQALDVTPSQPDPSTTKPVDNVVKNPVEMRVIHSAGSVIARREQPSELHQILSFIHNRAVELDRLGAGALGDLLRKLCADLRDEFLI